MGWIEIGQHHDFEHAGQRYRILIPRAGGSYALIAGRLGASDTFHEVGYRGYLPNDANDSEVRAAVDRLQRRIEAGDKPDEVRGADEN